MYKFPERISLTNNSTLLYQSYKNSHIFLDQTRAIFWMRINVSYKTTKVAAYCLEAHEQALVDNEEILTQQVSFYCNSTLINVGRISINKTTSTTSSFKVRSTIVSPSTKQHLQHQVLR